jgi:hypothetical protein
MSSPIETYQLGEYKLEIIPDPTPSSPRGDFNVTTMVCFHKRYDLGDKDHGFRHGDYSSWEEMKRDILKRTKARIIKPLYMYDHSGQTISTSPFSCEWDSGQIGWVFITPESIKEAGHKRPRKATLEQWLETEVNVYDIYIRGEIYGFRLLKNGEEEESCWGFYEADPLENGMSDYLPDEVVDALRAKLGKKAA